MGGSDLNKRIVNMQGKLGWHIKLPAQLTNIGDAVRPHRGHPKSDVLPGSKLEIFSTQIRSCNRTQQIARIWPHDGNNSFRAGNIGNDDTRLFGQVALQPVQIAHLTCTGSDNEIGGL